MRIHIQSPSHVIPANQMFKIVAGSKIEPIHAPVTERSYSMPNSDSITQVALAYIRLPVVITDLSGKDEFKNLSSATLFLQQSHFLG